MKEKIISVIHAQIREAEKEIKSKEKEIEDAREIIDYIWSISAK